MKYLGIDYGKRRVGVALSDETGSMAFPHSVVQNSPRLVEEIGAICTEEEVGRVVLGESKDHGGEENPIMEAVHTFKENFEKRFSEIPVIYEPEFFTTQEAKRLQGKNDLVDASAAALILKSYLDRRGCEE